MTGNPRLCAILRGARQSATLAAVRAVKAAPGEELKGGRQKLGSPSVAHMMWARGRCLRSPRVGVIGRCADRQGGALPAMLYAAAQAASSWERGVGGP